MPGHPKEEVDRLTCRAIETMASGFVPISRLVPWVNVTGRSVLLRKVRHGMPNTVVSS
jgi:hypothetical protein